MVATVDFSEIRALFSDDDPDFIENIPDDPGDPNDWRRRLVVCDPPVLSLTPCTTIDEARLLLESTINEYVQRPNPTTTLVVKAPPGLGKTQFAVRLCERLALAGRNVLYLAPRHDFVADILRLAQHHALWFEWLARQAGNDLTNKVQTCVYPVEITQWMNRGFKGIKFCAGVCGWEYANTDCVFHKQKRDAVGKIVIGQHQHLTSGHPLTFDVVIIDECPMNAFLWEWEIPGRFIAPQGMRQDEPFTEVVEELARIARQDMTISGRPLMAALGGGKHVREAIEAFNVPNNAVLQEPEIHDAHDVENKPYGHLFALAALLLREADAYEKGGDYPHRVVINEKKMLLMLRHKVSDRFPPYLICLDATANEDIYQRLFLRPVEVVDPKLPLSGHIHQVWERANGKGRFKEGSKYRQVALEKMQQQISEIARRYQKVAVITYQELEEHMPRNVTGTGHFYADRGTNRFDDVDAIIVAGTPMPPQYNIEKLARMVSWDRMTPFMNDQGKLPWTTRDVPYQYTDANDGKGRAYPTGGFWADPDLQSILWQVREAEIIQSAHRSRPLFRACDIWLLTNIPITDLPPERLISTSELFGAPLGVDPYQWPMVEVVTSTAYREGKPLYSADLVHALGISKGTARSYLHAITKHYPTLWQWPDDVHILPRRGEGRPAKGIVPT